MKTSTLPTRPPPSPRGGRARRPLAPVAALAVFALMLLALPGCTDAPRPAPAAQSAANNGLCGLPSAICGGTCRDLTSDPANCGACGTVCTGANTSCSRGRCVRTGTCDPGLFYCATPNHTCVDLQSDPANCGACNRACTGTNLSLIHI